MRRVALAITLLLAAASTATAAAGSAFGPWPTYHGDGSRAGNDTLDGALSPTSQAWTSPVLDGAVYAEPLVVAGRVIVATESDSLYALDQHNGQVLWRTNVGTPVPLASLPCGDIDPLGITGTPAVD